MANHSNPRNRCFPKNNPMNPHITNAVRDAICQKANSHSALLAENARLRGALIAMLKSEESPHSETVRYMAREDARAALAPAAGKGVQS